SNRAGEPISHELLPASSHCPDCGLPFHARNLLYVPAILQAPTAELLAEASEENNRKDTKIPRTKRGDFHVNANLNEAAGERHVRSPAISATSNDINPALLAALVTHMARQIVAAIVCQSRPAQ